jgi:hypothetical protein
MNRIFPCRPDGSAVEKTADYVLPTRIAAFQE